MHPADLHREVVGRVGGGGGGGRTDEGLEKSDGGWGGDDRQTAGGRKRQKNQRGPDRQTQQAAYLYLLLYFPKPNLTLVTPKFLVPQFSSLAAPSLSRSTQACTTGPGMRVRAAIKRLGNPS